MYSRKRRFEVKNERMLAQMALFALLGVMPGLAFASTHANLVQVVNKAVTSVHVATATSPVVPGQIVQISAAVSPLVSSVPMGTIQIVANGVNTGAVVTSGQLAVGSNGSTVWNPTFVTADQYVVVGTYSGDNNYLTSVSPQITQVVSAPGIPDFSVAWPSSITVASGQAVTTPLTVTGENGFSGTVTFSCSNLPQAITCSFANLSVNVPAVAAGRNTPATATTNLTISTTGVAAATAGAFLLMLGFAGKKRKRVTQIAFAVCALVLTSALYGCGLNQFIQNTDTIPGTYSVTLRATAGSIVHSQVVSLTVTPRQ
jgi:hypothetical protein